MLTTKYCTTIRNQVCFLNDDVVYRRFDRTASSDLTGIGQQRRVENQWQAYEEKRRRIRDYGCSRICQLTPIRTQGIEVLRSIVGSNRSSPLLIIGERWLIGTFILWTPAAQYRSTFTQKGAFWAVY